MVERGGDFIQGGVLLVRELGPGFDLPDRPASEDRGPLTANGVLIGSADCRNLRLGESHDWVLFGRSTTN